MKCHIEGCDRDARYKAAQLCQKHYFRVRRAGTTELVRKPARPRIFNRDGYVLVHAPGHPLSMPNHYVFEHRKVVYDLIGETVPNCELCGVPLTWKSARIDHIDRNVQNNDSANLRPLCNTCNTHRDMPPAHTFSHTHSLTFNGKTDTAAGWARDPRVKMAGRTIILRKQAGMSDYDALFAPKVTHNGAIAEKAPAPPKSTRRNAVNIAIDGEVKTSAEWSRDPRCAVSDATLRARVKAGCAQHLTILQPVIGYESRAKLRALKEQM
jgi:hypothetical protein